MRPRAVILISLHPLTRYWIQWDSVGPASLDDPGLLPGLHCGYGSEQCRSGHFRVSQGIMGPSPPVSRDGSVARDGHDARFNASPRFHRETTKRVGILDPRDTEYSITCTSIKCSLNVRGYRTQYPPFRILTWVTFAPYEYTPYLLSLKRHLRTNNPFRFLGTLPIYPIQNMAGSLQTPRMWMTPSRTNTLMTTSASIGPVRAARVSRSSVVWITLPCIEYPLARYYRAERPFGDS